MNEREWFKYKQEEKETWPDNNSDIEIQVKKHNGDISIKRGKYINQIFNVFLDDLDYDLKYLENVNGIPGDVIRYYHGYIIDDGLSRSNNFKWRYK